MWMFFSDSFLSIVRKGGKPTDLCVRARAKGDIERVFPRAKVICTEGNDYRFRAWINEDEVAAAVAKRIKEYTASNFKNSVNDHDRHDAYASTWGIMLRFQGLMKRLEQGISRWNRWGEAEEGYEEYPLFKETRPKGAGASQNRKRSGPRRS